MSNRRRLKKRISFVCGDMAAECLVTRAFVEGADAEKLENCIREIAALQNEALSRVNVHFDREPSDFANRHEYNKALKIFTGQAFASLTKDFNERVKAIVSEMNQALPAKKD